MSASVWTVTPPERTNTNRSTPGSGGVPSPVVSSRAKYCVKRAPICGEMRTTPRAFFPARQGGRDMSVRRDKGVSSGDAAAGLAELGEQGVGHELG